MKWNRTSEGRVPKNGVLLVSSGISWRREDMILVDESDVEMARTPLLKCAGQAILVYWRANRDLPPRLRTEAGGAWLQFPSNKPLLEMFDYWIAFENPITDDGLPEHHSASPLVPNLQTMETAKANIHYKPTDPRFLEEA